MANFNSFINMGLEQLSEGFGIFDENLCLVKSNKLFQTLRNYPENLCQPGTNLKSLINFNAERGDFGEGSIDSVVSNIMSEILKSDQREIEREMADGKFLKIRYRHLAEGGLTITFEDKTLEHTTRLALEASEERNSLVVKATSDGLYDWDIVTDELYVSDRIIDSYSIADTILTSRQWEGRVHKNDKVNYIGAMRDYFKGVTDHFECEYRILGKDGGYRQIRDYGIGVADANGRMVRLVGAVRDIDDIKSAEEERDKAEKRLLDSLETIADGFLLVDADDKVVLWNRRYMEIFGGAAEEKDPLKIIYKGRPFLEMIRDGYNQNMFKPHPLGADGWVADRRVARKKLATELEIELRNGQWILINERRMSDGGRVSVYTDVTDFKKREYELSVERARFEDAIEAISSGFVLFDADDRLVVCNTKFREYFEGLSDLVRPGTKFMELVETAVARGLFPESDTRPKKWLEKLVAERNHISGYREQHMKNGLWLQVSDHRTKDGGIVSIYSDITELKNQETKLRDQSNIMEATLENMEQAISMVDENLNTVVFNSKFLKFFDFPKSEFKRGFNMAQAFRLNAERGEYGEGDVEEMVRERMELSSKFLAHRFERVTQSGVTFEIAGNPVETGGFVTTYTDITERKKVEDDLRNSQIKLNAALQEFTAVLDTIEYGILFTGPDFRVRISNRAFANLWRIPQSFFDTSPTIEEMIEYNRDSNLYDVKPEDWDGWIKDRVAAIHAGALPATEMHRADGKYLQFQCIALPDGGRMLTYFDITILKDREADLIIAKNEAERALEDLRKTQDLLVQSEKMASLGQLTAGIAHEIKNPLNFVNNFSSLSMELLEELEDIIKDPIAKLASDEREDAKDIFETIKSNLDKIATHGKRADGIVKNMLLHSRDGPSEMQLSNPNALAEEALNLAYHGTRAEHQDFNIDIKKTLGDVGEIDCFPQDLMRVFLNVITNGIYAANKKKPGTDIVEASHIPTIDVKTYKSKDNVVIEFRDNGMGMSPEIQEKIFTPFFTTKPAGEGTGLGLSLSYDIVVKQHGGTMAVESELGEFTRFIVTLPCVLPTRTPTKAAGK